jgi:archaeal flagellar protein FlaJ
MSPRTYAMKYALPISIAGLVFGIALLLFGDLYLQWWLAISLGPLIMVGSVGLAIAMPIVLYDRLRVQINNALPFFTTHFGVLSTTNLPRTEIFRILGEKPEYKALGGELLKVFSLVTNWNMSLPEAVRFVGQRTPSQIFADFLERLAHAFESGQDLENFLKNEQGVIMKEYSTVYKTSIYAVENWKDLYISTLMSAVFFVIFAIISPIISGGDPTAMIYGVFGMFVFMEALLFAVLKMRVPTDRLWHRAKIKTKEKERIRKLILVGFGSSAFFAGVLLLIPVIPMAVALSLGVAPLVFVGVISRNIENRIRRREDNYPAFIRSIGATIAARGGSVRDVLRRVRIHNYGALNELINNLYSRLTWRIDDTLAWRHFSAESGSNLITAFNNMFIEGIRSGGKPDVVGEIISNNIVEILNLRKSRYSAAGTFRGLLIGITASMAFVLFIGVGILEVLGTIFTSSAPDAGSVPAIGLSFNVDVGPIANILFWVILYHAFFAALDLKMVDGGSYPAGLHTFVIMAWIAVGVQWLTDMLMPTLFGGLVS